ncbi:hypothetical protein F5B22DRAFT_652456 [Xylaria bambusicola]|uniref:uncharacterized protein n=1 Tax=Xylaria bambusicola TaxID=326684 RepID=UPI002008BCF0|nr:uncharacterized protein F5B22DRAFT_652456 [Xylaria bambusicola]KAI0503055.1 hypothetical protein F5B22DRAFT_652456 [Xylaria bambusicola]
MTTPLSTQEAMKRIGSSSQIHMHAFEVALGVLTGLALLCFVGRIVIRLKYQRQLCLDDAFLILAAAALVTATGILYHICYFLYLHSAALLDPEVLPYVVTDFNQLLNLQKKTYPYLALIWTTTYAVKACFLAFMRPLVWHISRGVNWYYWFTVTFSLVSWAFVVAEPFIICPYFGLDAMQCFNSTVNKQKTVALTALVTVLDILSDIMVVSLPIIVLKNSLLSRSTKFGLAIFLCLSIFMAILAIVRISGFYYNGLEDDIWEFFWQQTEGAVAVMTASLTAFRTLFIKRKGDHRAEAPEEVLNPNKFRKFLAQFKALAQEQPEEKPTSTSSTFKLPKVPSPILTGLRSFIHKNNQNGAHLPTNATIDSAFDDYHITLQKQTPSATSHGRSNDSARWV